MAIDRQQLGGSMVALVTPMHADGSVDWQALERLINWHIEQGTHGIVAVGTTGESATLGFREHDEVIERTVEIVDKRIPVIAGTGGNATDEPIRLTRHAKRVGADASLLVCPYYNKPSQEGLYRHFHAIAMAVDIPQILYNVPSRTGSRSDAAGRRGSGRTSWLSALIATVSWDVLQVTRRLDVP